MEPFHRLVSTALSIPGDNINTDAILPARFLKTATREGLGAALFHNVRYEADGSSFTDFVLNQPAAKHAAVLISGGNFGCGSSREHAPWALLDFGFRAIVARSFADIFYNNCINCGLLPAIVSEAHGLRLLRAADLTTPLTVDLALQTIGWDSTSIDFSIGTGAKRRLLQGLDKVGETLGYENDIVEFERRRATQRPWLR
jgi:3-isopropylmalate/(R)-2-methylmalate dehydratase small subunit